MSPWPSLGFSPPDDLDHGSERNLPTTDTDRVPADDGEEVASVQVVNATSTTSS